MLGRLLGAARSRPGRAPLTRMRDAASALDPRVTITEDTADGVAPAFQAEGFARPARVPLIDARARSSARWSRRAPRASSALAGQRRQRRRDARGAGDGRRRRCARDDALAALGTGLYVGNLWYLNYSDRPACRMTGMTRFATFWVEDGSIVAPVDVLRFDDTLYRMLGANLEALTRETELLLSTDTYRERPLASMRLPGALCREMAFTL